MAFPSVPLASFTCQARGIKFYGVPTSLVVVGASLDVQLEPSNPFDANCVSLFLPHHGPKLGHLAREAAANCCNSLSPPAVVEQHRVLSVKQNRALLPSPMSLSNTILLLGSKLPFKKKLTPA